MSRQRSATRNDAWRAAYAAVAGSSHLRTATPCQDAAAKAVSPGTTAVCVCDGAGSASRSDQGAAAVAQAMAVYLTGQAPWIMAAPTWQGEILKVALATIDRLVEEQGGAPEDYACTLLGAVITADRVLTIHLGDGVIAWVNRGTPETLSAPDNGEYANVTVFVTTPGAEKRIRIRVMPLNPNVSTVALMTDGSQASLYDRRQGFPSMVLEQMAAWLDDNDEASVSSKLAATIQQHLIPRTHDDCTVAILRRIKGAGDFVCPGCRRWTLVRKRAGRSRFVLTCSECGVPVLTKTLASGTYPVSWVRHLVSVMGMTPQTVWRVTRAPVRVLRDLGLARKF